MADQEYPFNWEDEDTYWRENYRDRPYASSGRGYDFFQPGYRFGSEAGYRHGDRPWDDVESDLAGRWNSYEYRGTSTWEQVKDAVRDAWDRVTGKSYVGTRH